MRNLIGLATLLLALTTGYLALTAGLPAFTSGTFPPYEGQIRGIVFTIVMAAATAGLLWMAARSVGRRN